MRVTLKALALLSRNVLFCAPLVLVVFSSRETSLQNGSVGADGTPTGKNRDLERLRFNGNMA